MTIEQSRLIKPGAARSALIAVARIKNEDEFGHEYYNAEYPGPVHVVKIGNKASLATEDGDERHSLHNENGFLLVLACLDENNRFMSGLQVFATTDRMEKNLMSAPSLDRLLKRLPA